MALPENCPLCHSERQHQHVVTNHVYGDKGDGRAFFHCRDCDVRYLYPGLTQEEEKKFYAAEFESFMTGRAGNKGGWDSAQDHIRANETTRVRRMKYLQKHLTSGASLLEVGCSSGFMLIPFAQAGHACTGIEPSGIFSAHVRKCGLTVYESLEQLLQLDQRPVFDVVMHFFVLEHVAEPDTFLSSLLQLVKRGGKIIFEVPNASDPLYSVYDIPAFERFYWSVAHRWYFNETALGHLLSRIGKPYEIIRDQRYDLSNHMVWARDGRPGGMGRFTGILGQDVEESYKQALIRSGKCDTLIGIVRND